MKTMKKSDEVVRVSENEVKKNLVAGYSFCNKSEWKQKVRDKDKKPVEKVKEHRGGNRPQSKYRQKMANNAN